jgi:hypothetical protein
MKLGAAMEQKKIEDLDFGNVVRGKSSSKMQ